MTPPCGRKSHKSSTLLHWCQLDDSAEESWCAVYREHCTTGQVTQVTSWPAHHQCVSRQQHTVEWAGNIYQCDVNIYMNSEMGGCKIDIHTETPHEKNMKQITNISDKGGNFVIWLESWSLSDKHVDCGVRCRSNTQFAAAPQGFQFRCQQCVWWRGMFYLGYWYYASLEDRG